MTEFFRTLASIGVPIFVISSMLNVGLTQKPTKLLGHLKNWHYLVRMIMVNLIVVPAIMLLAVTVVDLDPVHAAGLLLFSMCAGAPFLIKLTMASENDLALGATVLMVLMVATVVWLPIMLPLVIEGIEVDALAIAWSLFTQMILPIIVGMVVTHFLDKASRAVQPWVARISNIALYTILVATLLGYLQEMADLMLWKAVATGLVVILFAFGVGFMMGDGHSHLKDVGGLSTAQRGTAAAMIVASQNFTDPQIFVIVNVVNTLGIIMLIAIAKTLHGENQPILLDTPGADLPAPRTAG